MVKLRGQVPTEDQTVGNPDMKLASIEELDGTVNSLKFQVYREYRDNKLGIEYDTELTDRAKSV